MSSLEDRRESPRRKPSLVDRLARIISNIFDWFMVLIVLMLVWDFVETGRIDAFILALWIGRSLASDWGRVPCSRDYSNA